MLTIPQFGDGGAANSGSITLPQRGAYRRVQVAIVPDITAECRRLAPGQWSAGGRRHGGARPTSQAGRPITEVGSGR